MITHIPRVAIVVRNFDEAMAHFRDGLGMPVSEFSAEALGIRIGFCAPDSHGHIELMAPHEAGKPLSDTLTHTLDRRGEGFYAMMFYAADPDAEAEVLASRGLPPMPLMPGAAGRDFHPRSTGGVLLRIYPIGIDKRIERSIAGDLGPPEGRDSQAGLSGIRAVQIAVADLDQAVATYRDQLGLDTEIGESAASRTRIAICRPPERSSWVELHAPTHAESDIAEFSKAGGTGLFAIVHETRNPEATVARLAERGVATERRPDGTWEIDRAITHGARIRFRAA